MAMLDPFNKVVNASAEQADFSIGIHQENMSVQFLYIFAPKHRLNFWSKNKKNIKNFLLKFLQL